MKEPLLIIVATGKEEKGTHEKMVKNNKRRKGKRQKGKIQQMCQTCTRRRVRKASLIDPTTVLFLFYDNTCSI